MPKAVVIRKTHISKICRTCLSDEALISIYDECGSTVCILDKLMSCTLVQFTENEGLPEYICAKCADQINQAYLFSKRCEEVDRILRIYYDVPLIKKEQTKKEKNSGTIEVIDEDNIEIHDDFHYVVLSSNSEDEDDSLETTESKEEKTETEEIDDPKVIIHIPEYENIEIINEITVPNNEITVLNNEIIVPNNEITVTNNEITVTSNEIEEKADEIIKNSKKPKKGPPYECRKCNISYPVFHQLKEHYRKPQHKNNTHITCQICSKSIKYLYYHKHLRLHKGNKSYCCEICGKQFNNDSNLARHKKIHYDVKPYLCDLCGKGFSQSTTMKAHRRIHTGEKPYTCSICGKSFRISTNLKIHMDVHMKMKENGSTDWQENPDYKPIKASRNIPIEEWLNKEIISRRANAMKTDDDSLECKICNQTFRSFGGLKTHLGVHEEKRFKCTECLRKFSSQEKLQSHMKSHSAERPFSCEVCGKTFLSKPILKNHIFLHTGQKPYVCPHCDRSFVHLGQLKSHLKVHTGDRPYVCKYCGKAFALNGNLTVHMRKHTGETPFVCNVCNKGFHDSSSLKKHQKGHGALQIAS